MLKTAIAALVSVTCWAAGFALNEHLEDHRQFKDTVTAQLIELNKKTGNTKKLIIKNDVVDGYQGEELDNIRERITRLEDAVYELSNHYPAPLAQNDKIRRRIPTAPLYR